MLRMRLVALVGAVALGAIAHSASAQPALMREGDIVDLRVGQRVLVDDGSCGSEAAGSRTTVDEE